MTFWEVYSQVDWLQQKPYLGQVIGATEASALTQARSRWPLSCPTVEKCEEVAA